MKARKNRLNHKKGTNSHSDHKRRKAADEPDGVEFG
jgi:hypothetical protein